MIKNFFKKCAPIFEILLKLFVGEVFAQGAPWAGCLLVEAFTLG
jgi:hypothetical protein